MTVEENRRAVERFMAALASDADRSDLEQVCTAEVGAGWRAVMEDFSFDDVVFAIEDMVAEGDKVAIVWSNSGHHARPFLGLPATGRRTTGRGSAMFSFTDGRISAVDSFYDTEGLLQQLGATITPGS